MRLVIALMASIWLMGTAQAAPLWLFCPYEQVVTEETGAYRTVSIDRFSQAICAERHFARCGAIGQEPWSEQELRDNQALVYTDVSAAMHTQLLSAQPTGAGCTVATRAALQGDVDRPRGERTLIRHRDDGIAPVRDDILTHLEARVPQRRSWLEQTLTRVASLFAPSRVLAQLGAFPDASIELVDGFNRADANPLSGNWAGLAGVDQLQIIGNEAAGQDADDAVGYYTGLNGAADVDAQITLVDTGFIDIIVRVTDTANGGDGYAARQVTGNQSGSLFRWDDGVKTQLGAGCVGITWVAGDELGIRAEGDDLTSYHNTTTICTRVDATYGTAGAVGLLISNTNDRADAFSFIRDVTALFRAFPPVWAR